MKQSIKVTFSIILALCVLTLSGISGIAVTSQENNSSLTPTLCGDVNSDGKITAKDSLIVLRSTINLVTLNRYQQNVSDVNQDGKVTASDSLEILRYTIGIFGKGNTGKTYEDKNDTDSNTSSKDNTSSTSSKDNTSSTSSKDNTSSTSSKDNTSSTSSKDNTSSTSSKDNTSSTSSKDNTSSTSMDHGHGDYVIVLNTKTKKYHTTHCNSVDKILPGNRFDYYTETPGGTQDDRRYIESFGYVQCKNCAR